MLRGLRVRRWVGRAHELTCFAKDGNHLRALRHAGAPGRRLLGSLPRTVAEVLHGRRGRPLGSFQELFTKRATQIRVE